MSFWVTQLFRIKWSVLSLFAWGPSLTMECGRSERCRPGIWGNEYLGSDLQVLRMGAGGYKCQPPCCCWDSSEQCSTQHLRGSQWGWAQIPTVVSSSFTPRIGFLLSLFYFPFPSLFFLGSLPKNHSNSCLSRLNQTKKTTCFFFFLLKIQKNTSQVEVDF